MQLAWWALIGFAAVGLLLGPLNNTCCLVGPNAQYRTIQSAIDAAPSGSTIVVFSGVYRENLVINKSVRIFNANHTAILPMFGQHHVLIQARDNDLPAVSVSVPNVTLQGFNIRGGRAGVYLNSHHIKVLDNHISDGREGIVVENGQEIWLSRNTITQQTERGVRVAESRHVRLLENVIERNKDGVLLEATERSQLRQNTLRHHEQSSITLSRAPDNALLGNRVSNVDGAGVVLDHSPQTLMRGNALDAGNRSFWIEASSRKDYEQNIDASNTLSGNPMLYLKGLKKRRLKPGIQVGYLALIDASEITLSHLSALDVPAGVVLVNASNVTIQQSTMERTRVGVLARWSTGVSISDSAMTGATLNGVRAEQTEGLTLARVRIENAGDNGVFVRNSQFFSIQESSLAGNETGSVWVEDSADGVLADNAFSNNQYAVYLKNTQRLTLSDNVIDGNLTGLYLEGAQDNMLEHNLILQNQYGIFLKTSTGNTISGNTLSENWRGAIGGVVEDNVIEDNEIDQAPTSDVEEDSSADPETETSTPATTSKKE